MSKNNYTIMRLATALVLVLTLASCEKEKPKMRINFSATMEQLDDGSKVRLVNERYVYWEYDDCISIASDLSTGGAGQEEANLVNSGSEDFSDYNGVFVTSLPEGSKYFLGLHPAHDNNVITPAGSGNSGFSASIYLRPTQPYRNDSSFAKQVLPMVAWYGGHWDDNPGSTPFNLDFHSLAGLVRLQFYNSSNADHTITSITVSCADKQLCGMFNVNGIKTYNPSLTATADGNASFGTLTLSMPGNALEFKKDSLRSFYLVLPSRSGSDAGDEYALHVTVNTDGGSFSRDLTVKIRRNGITYTRAVGITAFSPISYTNGIVGNGTLERPFKIYKIAELQAVRDSFAHPRLDGNVYLNGQKVTSQTEFRIMRSDIVLNTSNWTAGISNFKGHMLYNSNAAVALHGITNTSNRPLFESISSDGVVEGLTVKSNHSVSNSSPAFSLFCNENNGKIVDCHMTTPSTEDPSYHLRFYGTAYAGICCTNNGTIEGSTCSVLARIAGNFAGICHTNSATGTIKGCIASSPLNVYNATHAAGICYQNSGTIEDCYFDARYTAGATIWGGICYQNSKTIRHSYISDGAVIHGTTVGGIAVNNTGTIDYCWCGGELRGTTVGGIAANQSGANSKLTNCFVDNNLFVITLLASASSHYAGGLVAVLNGGSVKDSYTLINQIQTRDNTGVYGSLAGHIGAGAKVDNCYSYVHASVEANPAFYGDTVAGARVFTHCYIVGSTQTGITTVANESSPLGTLLTNLQTNHTCTYSWQSGTTLNGKTYPELEVYTRSTP